MRWVGRSGEWVWVTRGAVEASRPLPRDAIVLACGAGARLEHGPALARHLRDFIDCVRSRRPCIAPAEEARRAATLGHLGDLAMRTGRIIRFGPAAEALGC